jgi:hypothetical protein
VVPEEAEEKGPPKFLVYPTSLQNWQNGKFVSLLKIFSLHFSDFPSQASILFLSFCLMKLINPRKAEQKKCNNNKLDRMSGEVENLFPNTVWQMKS